MYLGSQKFHTVDIQCLSVGIFSGIESNRKKDPEKMRRIMELVEQYRNNTD